MIAGDLPAPRVSVWNVANALTAARIGLVPIFAWLLLESRTPGFRLSAALVFAIAVVTDRLDGEVARRHGLVTDLGKIADPIADKALIGAALIGLSMLGELSWWVTAVVLTREIGITLLRFALLRHVVMPAGHGGKVKTAVQALAIVMYLVPLGSHWRTAAEVVMAVAVVLTVGTGLDYLYQAARLRPARRA